MAGSDLHPGRQLEEAIQVISSVHILAALARERSSTFMAEAEAARQARQARSGRQRAGRSAARRSLRHRIPRWLRPGWSRLPDHRPRPAAGGRSVALRDGSKVLIRPVRSDDAALLADGFARLSARSRQLRFLRTKNELSPAELRYFTDIDHHDHEALGALNTGRWARRGYRPLHPGRQGPAGRRDRHHHRRRLAGPGTGHRVAGPAVTAPAPKASAVSPPWSRSATRRWPGCCAT